MIRIVAALLITAVSAAAIAQAPANPPVRLRGTVERIDRTHLTVKTNTGQSMDVTLADNFVVMGIAKASLADVASGKFIGTTTLGERDGALVALEVHIFPENMRGTGEGHYDWDLRPTSKMTNANVANVTSMGKERVLTVQYKGGEKKVLAPGQALLRNAHHRCRQPGAVRARGVLERRAGVRFPPARRRVDTRGRRGGGGDHRDDQEVSVRGAQLRDRRRRGRPPGAPAHGDRDRQRAVRGHRRHRTYGRGLRRWRLDGALHAVPLR